MLQQFAKGARFTVTMQQRYPGKDHNVGRFRLSVTTAKPPLSLTGPPQAIAGILSTDATKRTPAQKAELTRIQKAAAYCAKLGLECHAGHGLNYENVKPIAAIANVRELNIGHFLIGEAIFVGLKEAIREMRRLMDEARSGEVKA